MCVCVCVQRTTNTGAVPIKRLCGYMAAMLHLQNDASRPHQVAVTSTEKVVGNKITFASCPSRPIVSILDERPFVAPQLAR